MPPLNGPSAHQHPFMIDRDTEHLNLLALYHTVLAVGVGLLWVFVYILPLVLGSGYSRALHLPDVSVGSAMHRLWLQGVASYGAQTLVLGMNAWMQRERKHWLSCVLLSCMECLAVPPLGFIWGVSAVLTLRRESVKTLFAERRQGI